jgi:hypothetical protein
MFRTLLTVSLCLSALTVSAQEATFNDVKQYITTGDKTHEVKATLTISDDALTVTPQSKMARPSCSGPLPAPLTTVGNVSARCSACR